MYIRYRIYVQRAIKADNHYPSRLIKSLSNLNQKVNEDRLLFLRPYWEENVISKTFIPENLNHINPQYFNLISNISQYFGCLAIWEKTMIKGTNRSINTFKVVGYYQDALLTFHYLSKIINNLEDMRFNVQKEYRRTRLNSRRRGIKQSGITATQKSSKYFYNSLENITLASKELLDNRTKEHIITAVLKDKHKSVKLVTFTHLKLSPKKYHYKNMDLEKWLIACRSRINKFVNKRIIIVN